jgi:hypothetical protein
MPKRDSNFNSFKKSNNSIIKEEPSVEDEESKSITNHHKVLYDKVDLGTGTNSSKISITQIDMADSEMFSMIRSLVAPSN